MSSKWSYILGTATIVVIIGGVIYGIKKSKDNEKVDGEEITLTEARKIVREREEQEKAYVEPLKAYSPSDDIQKIKLTVGPMNINGVQTSFEVSDVTVLDEETDEEEDTDFLFSDGVDPKEDKELRYDPNSRDARNQFIRMELAEWVPLEDNYQILLRLFEFPFVPQNDGDEMLRTQIIDFRVQFFGFASKWSKEVTIADIILHYSKAADFNCGEGVRYWVNYFLEFNEIDLNTPSHEIDDLLLRLNSHTYFNEERQTFGLFGLTRESMDQALKIAHRNIDSSVTYEIEFNEFLKSCL